MPRLAEAPRVDSRALAMKRRFRGLAEVRIYGSYARGEQREASDLDLCDGASVEFSDEDIREQLHLARDYLEAVRSALRQRWPDWE